MRTIAVSGSCKREDASSHAVLVGQALEACSGHPKVRVYCIATDGDARRRQAIASLTLGRKPEHNSALCDELANLPLFNTLCGKDDVNACTDKKHNDKRCRNTLLRRKGTTIAGVHITIDTIEQHLTHITPDNPFCRETPGVLSPSAAAACLNPNDRQNVSLAFRLMSGIATLRTPLPCDSPNFALKRRVLNLLGTLYRLLLDPMTDTQMSLRGQLTNLGAASLVVLALYSANRGDFMPTQLYYDIQTYVKCAYFCVAKTKNDDPAGQFFLSQMGTDRLESGFGHVRTMVGGDSNADQLQLTSRLGALAECSALFDDHPEWDSTSRRLKYGGLRSVLNDTSRRVDHLGTASWSGDTYVSNVNLRTCWQQGMLIATSTLESAGITAPFDNMTEAGGFDILCPFGDNKIVLIDGLKDHEEDEVLPEEEELHSNITTEAPTADLQPDLEDHAMAESYYASVQEAGAEPIISTTVNVEGVQVDKRSILKAFSDPFSTVTSTDRLKRIQSISKFQTFTSPANAAIPSSDFGAPSILRDDPAVTLVRCNNRVFVSIVHINGLTWNGERVASIPLSNQEDSSAQVTYQIMRLCPTSATIANMSDWYWTQEYEHKSGLPSHEIPARFVQCINPEIVPLNSIENTTLQGIQSTYIFKSADLQGIAAGMFQQLANELPNLPQASFTDSFPYRSQSGKHLLVLLDHS